MSPFHDTPPTSTRRIGMQVSRIEFETDATVQECARIFQEAVRASYGPARRVHRVVSALRDGGSEGLEFFDPADTPFSSVEEQPDWKAGAFVPGFNKMHGAGRVAIHIYVLDTGDVRVVHLLGPYGTGGRGSTDRLLRSVRERF
jgi:hypothetical protein